jgi:hypothetical protein
MSNLHRTPFMTILQTWPIEILTDFSGRSPEETDTKLGHTVLLTNVSLAW